MKFFIKKITWSYTTNIKGDHIDIKKLYIIGIKNPFYKFFKKKKYLRICPTSSGKYIVKFTKDVHHTTKYNSREEALSKIEDIFKHPNNYEIE